MGCFSGPKVESSQLVAAFDAGNTKSYVGIGTTWNDLSGGSNTGALTYGPTYNSADGGAIVFDGSNDCVVVNSNASVLSNTAYTKTVWFYVTSFATNNNLISGGNNGRHAFSVSSSNKLQAGHNSTWNTISSPTPLSLNTWYHAAVTFSTTTGWRLYLNGVLDSTNSSTSTVFSAYDVADALFAEVPYGVGYGATTTFLGSGEILLGGYGTGSNAFSGRISNAFVYNRVLSATEIQQNYNALAPRFPTPISIVTSGLVLNLDAGNGNSYSGSGTTWTDLSGNNNTGTLVNGPTYSSANGGSIVFDGTNDYVALTGSTTVSQATFSVWLRRNGSQNAYAGILFTRGGSSANVSGLDFNSTNNTLGYHWNDTAGSYQFNSGLIPPDGAWSMCVVVVTSTAATFYLCQSSGITTATNTLAHASTTLDGLKLGWDGVPSRYMNGNIAQVSIYNKALSAEEVSQNFNATRGRFGL
jgi:hypothetical protein